MKITYICLGLCMHVSLFGMDKKNDSFIHGNTIYLDLFALRYTGGNQNCSLIDCLRQQKNSFYINKSLERFYMLPNDVQTVIKKYLGYASILRMYGNTCKPKRVQTLHDTYKVLAFSDKGTVAALKTENDIWLKEMRKNREELVGFPCDRKITTMAISDTTTVYGQSNGSVYLKKHDDPTYFRIIKQRNNSIRAITLSETLCAFANKNDWIVVYDIQNNTIKKDLYRYWDPSSLQALAMLHNTLFLATADGYIFKRDININSGYRLVHQTNKKPTSLYVNNKTLLIGLNNGACIWCDMRKTSKPLFTLAKKTMTQPLSAVGITTEGNVITGSQSSIVEWQKTFDYNNEWKNITLQELSILHNLYQTDTKQS